MLHALLLVLSLPTAATDGDRAGVCDAAKAIEARTGRRYEIGADVSCGDVQPRAQWGLAEPDDDKAVERFERTLLFAGYTLREEKTKTRIDKREEPSWLQEARADCRGAEPSDAKRRALAAAAPLLRRSLQVQVDADGHTLWARVDPPLTRGDALGACLERAAKAAQHEPGEPALHRYSLMRGAVGGLAGGQPRRVSRLEAKLKGPSGDAVSAGSLSRDVIRGVVREHGPQLRACYEGRLAQNLELAGKVVVRWKVGKDGGVRVAEVVENETRDQPLGACLLDEVLRWRFPKPKGGGQVVITYPFVFKQQTSPPGAKNGEP